VGTTKKIAAEALPVSIELKTRELMEIKKRSEENII